jgi:hypothetical protein
MSQASRFSFGNSGIPETGFIALAIDFPVGVRGKYMAGGFV